jgi:predicted protein tyrosine phosphatase
MSAEVHFYVCGRMLAREYQIEFAPSVIVSITDPKSHPVRFNDAPQAKIVRLEFHDYCDQMPQDVIDGLLKDGHPTHLFDRAAARTILDEVLPVVINAPRGPMLIVVHCEAGLSRSVGVARALSRILGDNGIETVVHGVHAENTGNSRVVRELLEEAERRGVYRKPFTQDPPLSLPKPKLRFTD